MKKILVLTDFSANASHAGIAALLIARQMHCDLLLYHAFHFVPGFSSYVGEVMLPGEPSLLTENSEENLNNLAQMLRTMSADAEPGFKPAIETGYEAGSAGGNLEDILKGNDIEMIVMGEGTDDLFDSLTNASETHSVIRHSDRPVLIVPQQVELESLKRVVFASDLRIADIKAIRYLVVLARFFDFSIDVIHVNDGHLNENMPVELFNRELENLHFPRLRFEMLDGKHAAERINLYCCDRKADLLAVVHYKRGLLNRLFGRSTTFELTKLPKVPLLVFPVNFSTINGH